MTFPDHTFRDDDLMVLALELITSHDLMFGGKMTPHAYK
jgi:hypothetical protein